VPVSRGVADGWLGDGAAATGAGNGAVSAGWVEAQASAVARPTSEDNAKQRMRRLYLRLRSQVIIATGKSERAS